MRQIIFIAIALIITGCKLEVKNQSDNEVQGHQWLGVSGAEEIRNDTIFYYEENTNGKKLSYRIIQEVTDSTITYMNFNQETNSFSERIAVYENKLIDNNPYLIIYFKSSVSMFTRKRTCPFKFRSFF